MKNNLRDIAIRPMAGNDLEGVVAIECESFPRPWKRDHFLDEMKCNHAFPLVAVDREGMLIGYIFPRFFLDEGHILNVAVKGDCRGKGVGRRLVERVLRDCRELGASLVSLEVRQSNSTAIALYRLLGFVVTGKRRNYYENGEDAILMERIFTGNGEDDAV